MEIEWFFLLSSSQFTFTACCALCCVVVALINIIQRRPASPLVDVYVSFEQTIETLRDKLQRSDFELCRVSCCSRLAVLHVASVWLSWYQSWVSCMLIRVIAEMNAAIVNVLFCCRLANVFTELYLNCDHACVVWTLLTMFENRLILWSHVLSFSWIC